MEPTLEDRVTRLEHLEGLQPLLLKHWDITSDRIKALREKTGWSLKNTIRNLVENFGELIEEEEEL